MAQSKTSIQETGAAHVTTQTSIKETCADTLSAFPCQASLFTQRTIPTTERALSAAVSKMVTRVVRHYDQGERQPDAALHWDTMRPVLLKAFAKWGARDFKDKRLLRLVHHGSSKTRFEYCEDSKNSVAYSRAIQEHSGGITIDPELMEHILTPYVWVSALTQACQTAGVCDAERWSDATRRITPALRQRDASQAGEETNLTAHRLRLCRGAAFAGRTPAEDPDIALWS